VERVVQEYVRPSLKLDGGDVEIMDIKGTLVYCNLKGACAHCVGASQTLKMMVERILKDQVDERIRVIEV
jgi:NifU-like protein